MLIIQSMPSKNNIAVSSSAFNPHGLDDKPLVEAATSFNRMEEIWKDVKGYEGIYRISNLGRIKSLKRFNVPQDRLLNQVSLNNKGYHTVMLSANGSPKRFLIHRLIAISFIPNPNNKPYINHIDGNPLNNSISNLEWCTQKENMVHASLTGLLNNVRPKGKDNKNYKHGRKVRISENRICAGCNNNYIATVAPQKYCSHLCSTRNTGLLNKGKKKNKISSNIGSQKWQTQG